MKYNLKMIFLLLSTLILAVIFQNCARPEVGVSTSQSASSTASRSPTSSSSSAENQQASQSQPSSSTTMPSASTSATTQTTQTTQQASSLMNIVAGDKSTCDLAVADYIRTKLSSGVMSLVAPRCQVGAGCGISCGKPNGTSCVSANPNAYGVCLDKSDVDTYVMQNMQVYIQKSGFNFVAGSETDCNSSIQESHRYAAGSPAAAARYCKIGGGCGISCGKPNGSSCVSANPNVMGACFGYDEFKNL